MEDPSRVNRARRGDIGRCHCTEVPRVSETSLLGREDIYSSARASLNRLLDRSRRRGPFIVE